MIVLGEELWTGKSKSADVKINYQYVLEQRERLEKTIKFAEKKKQTIKLDTKITVAKRQRIDC